MNKAWMVIDSVATQPAEGWRGYADDELVEEDQGLRNAMQAGLVAALPVERELLQLDPVAGYFKRAWGRGARLDGMALRRVCPMLLHVHPDVGFIHWRALVIPTRQTMPHGSIRLVTLPSPSGAFTGGLASNGEAVELAKLGAPGPLDGWVVGGTVRVTCAAAGYLSLGLLASADGVAVRWSAVSQAARPE